MRFTKTLRFRLIVVTVLCTDVAPSIHGGDPVLAFVRPIQGWAAARGRGICTWSCSWPCLTRCWPPTLT